MSYVKKIKKVKELEDGYYSVFSLVERLDADDNIVLVQEDANSNVTVLDIEEMISYHSGLLEELTDVLSQINKILSDKIK